MLYIAVAVLLGLVVGGSMGYLLAKRGADKDTHTAPNGYFSGLLDGYDAAWAGLSIDLRCKQGPTNNPEQATHALLWASVPTEKGTIYAKAGTATAKGVKLEQDRVA